MPATADAAPGAVARDLHAQTVMPAGTRRGRRLFRAAWSVEIDAPVERVFAQWNRYETFPRVMDSVRRTKRIGEEQVLWDVDVAGRQIVWEARIVESVPDKHVRWESTWGATHAGEVRFSTLPAGRTRLDVEIELEPRGWLERIGVRLGLLDTHVAHDLARFRSHVEGLEDEDDPEEGEVLGR